MKEFPNIENYLPKDSIDYQRLMSFQEKAKNNGYPKGHLWMAGLAAFPVFLTPDLLHKIWLNFRHISYQNGQSLDIDRMAVSDLLLSTLVEEVAVEVFKIRPKIRTALLALLEEWSGWIKDGDNLIKRLADFTLRYVRSYQMEGESVTTAIRQAQEWNALAYFNPNAAAIELKKALSQAVEANAKQKVLRISLMLSEMDEQFTQLGQQEQQEQFRTLVNYGQGMQALIRGQKAEAVEAFKQIDRQAIATGEGATIGKKVQLPIPKEIYQAISVEDQVGSKTDANQLFVLLVGIAGYSSAEEIPYLEGVQADLNFWQDFFANQVEGEVQLNTLLNGAATKAAVLEAIKLECRKATAGSQVFFFFSGFGENRAHGRDETVLLLHDHQINSDAGTLAESEFRAQVESFLPREASITLFLDTHSGGNNWVDTRQGGRFIYNATDLDQGAQESPDGGLLTRAFRQALRDVGAPHFTHIGLMQRLRSLMPALSNGNDQTATWYGRRDQQTTAFLNLPAPSSLRLREFMVDTGLARSVGAVDVQAVLQQFRSEHSIPAHLSIEKALEIWASTQHKSFQVFISQSGQDLPLKSYLEDLLLDKNIPHEIFTHDLQREKELQMQKARPLAENDWSVRLVEADFVLLQIDEAWIKDPISEEVTALFQLRLMEAQVPYELIYASTCDWTSHPVNQLGEAWPAESLLEVYANKEEQEFVIDFRNQLTSPIDYIECFLSNPSSDLGIKMLQEQFISALLEDIGRYQPEEVAQLSSKNAEQSAQLAFIQNHYPTPIGQAITYLLQPRAHSEQLSATAQVWFMLVHTLNTFLVALLRQLVKRSGDELKELLKELGSAARSEIQNWLSGPSASAALLEFLQEAKLLPDLLEELGLHPETWQQLTERAFPKAVSDKIPLDASDTDHSRQVQATLSSNYSNLIQWFKCLEVLINLKWENICQLYSAKSYTPILFHEQGLNPFSENIDFFRFSHQVGEGQQLHFTNLEGTNRIIERGTEDASQLWENFQELFQLFGGKKAIPAHPEQVHALLVGINAYPESLPSLRAPENDTLQFKAYLDRQPLEAHTEILSGAVTKENVMETLTKVVEKAAPGDAVIFYFSGLGQKEQSPRLNDTIPAILTFDQQRIPIDEIVYLLCQDKEKALQPIIILDMGVNANISEEHRAAGRLPKGIDAVGPARDWSNYQFGDQIQSMEAWGAFMQEASFILMVGCDYDNESSLEDEQSSFFTRNLIEVLSRSRHFLPYPVLHERLTEVLSHQVPQTPDIRVEGPSESMSSPNFLGQPSIDFQPMYGRVEWNRRLQQWTIDMGQTFGITTGQIVHLCSTDFQGNSLVHVESIYDEFATLIFGKNMPDRSSTYLGFVDDFLGSPPLQVSINGWDEAIRETMARGLLDYLPSVIFQDGTDADFTIQAESEGFSVRRKEEPDYPLFRAFSKEPLHQTPGIRTLMRRLVIANALTHLSNNDVTQDPFNTDIGIELIHKVGTTETNLQQAAPQDNDQVGVYELDLVQDHEFRLTVTNQAKGRRYIAMLLVQADLGIKSLLEPTTVISLQSQKSIQSQAWNQIYSQLEGDSYEQPASLSTLKIIASDQAFNVDGWLQEGINLYEALKQGNSSIVKGISIKHDNLWSIQTIQIKHKNTGEEALSIGTLKQLLNDNKIDELLEILFPLIPEEQDLFQQLLTTGSRFHEVQRVKMKSMAETGPLAIQERRIEQNLSNLISSPELQHLLANQKERTEDTERSPRQTWYYTLLKNGITEALRSLPSFPEENQQYQEMLAQMQEAAEKNTMNFSGIRINLEEYLIVYSRHLAQLNSWVSSFDADIWNSTEDSSAADSKRDVPIENWEERKQQVKNLVDLGDHSEALQELRSIFPKQAITEKILLQQAKHSHIQQGQNELSITEGQVKMYLSRIASFILELLDKAAEEYEQEASIDWTGPIPERLLPLFLTGELEESLKRLMDVSREQVRFSDEIILLLQEFLQLRRNRESAVITEDEYFRNWNKLAASCLEYIKRFSSPFDAQAAEQPPQQEILPEDLTISIGRQEQYDRFVKVLSDSDEKLQVFFIPAPPKSEPQHFLSRLAWHLKTGEPEDTIIWDTIFVKSSTPLHQLSGQMEKAWEQRWRSRTIKSPKQILAAIQFDQDWFENRDGLAAWLASEGSKRIEQLTMDQLVVVIILEVPEPNSRSAIGRLLRGDPLERQLDWLAKLVGEYRNAEVLPTLDKVSLDELKDWLRTAPFGQRIKGTSPALSYKEGIAENKPLEVMEQLLQEPSLADEDRSNVLMIQSRFQEIERSRNMGILSTTDVQIRQSRAIQDLLNVISSLEESGFNSDALSRKELWDQLESKLSKTADGYHMEEVLNAIDDLSSLPIHSKLKRQSASIKPEEDLDADDARAWDEARFESTIESYKSYLSQYPDGLNSKEARLLLKRLERIKLTHKATPLPSTSSNPKERELSHNIEVKILGETEDIQSITSVTYFLHRSFKRHEITVNSAETNFALHLDVWEIFTIRATVLFKDGTEIKLERELDF